LPEYSTEPVQSRVLRLVGAEHDGVVTKGSRVPQTRWSYERPDREHGEPLGYVLLQFRVEQDDDGLFLGECIELGVSSCGDTLDEAVRATMEATAAYLESLDLAGEREAVFAERGVTLLPTVPDRSTEVHLVAHPGEWVTPQRLAVLAQTA
jgi:predicted RNase H-like HicB family nuclease